MNQGPFHRIMLSLFLIINWCLPIQANTEQIEVKIIPAESVNVTITHQKPLNLNLPDQYRARSAFRKDLDQSLALINATLPSEAERINNKAPLYTIPMEFEQSDLILAGTAAVAMMAITVTRSEVELLHQVQDQKSPGMDRTMKFSKRFGEELGKQMLGASIVWALVTDKDKKIMDIVPVQLQAVVAAGLANNLLKLLFRRALPTESPNNPYKTSASNRAPDHGIPSGHTTAAIVTAVIMAENMENLGPIAPAILYTMAALTGVSRVYHNQHWVTDVLASVYSYYLTKAILNKDKNQDSKHNLVIMPLIDWRTRTFGLYANYTLDPVESKPCGDNFTGLARVEACIAEACSLGR